LLSCPALCPSDLRRHQARQTSRPVSCCCLIQVVRANLGSTTGVRPSLERERPSPVRRSHKASATSRASGWGRDEQFHWGPWRAAIRPPRPAISAIASTMHRQPKQVNRISGHLAGRPRTSWDIFAVSITQIPADGTFCSWPHGALGADGACPHRPSLPGGVGRGSRTDGVGPRSRPRLPCHDRAQLWRDAPPRSWQGRGLARDEPGGIACSAQALPPSIPGRIRRVP